MKAKIDNTSVDPGGRVTDKLQRLIQRNMSAAELKLLNKIDEIADINNDTALFWTLHKLFGFGSDEFSRILKELENIKLTSNLPEANSKIVIPQYEMLKNECGFDVCADMTKGDDGNA